VLGFRPAEPLVKLTENQRQIARRILLGDWGEFPRENDDENRAENTRENATETGVETATKAGPFPTRETPSRRSEIVDNPTDISTDKREADYRALSIFGTVCGRCHETLLRVSYANGQVILFELKPIFTGTDVVLADHSCPADATPETLAVEAEAIDKADQLLSRVLRAEAAEGGAA